MSHFETLAQAAQDGELLDVVTLVASPEAQAVGQMLLLYQDGRQDGTIWDQDFTKKLIDYIQDKCLLILYYLYNFFYYSRGTN